MSQTAKQDEPASAAQDRRDRHREEVMRLQIEERIALRIGHAASATFESRRYCLDLAMKGAIDGEGVDALLARAERIEGYLRTGKAEAQAAAKMSG